MFIRNKKAESSIGTAITVVISVVLGGLVLVGAMTLIDTTIGPNMAKTFEAQQVNISREDDSSPEYVLGDVNLDGKVDMADVNYLKSHVAGETGYETIPNMKTADIDGDGEITFEDVRLLKEQVELASTVMIGDVNGDGKITSADATYITRYLAGDDKYKDIDKEAADVNGDGEITAEDSAIISKMITIYETYPELKKYRIGDVNMDGVIDSADITILNNHVLFPSKFPLTDEAKFLADINGDGVVNSTDTKLLQVIVNRKSTPLRYDINKDGEVTSKDIAYLKRYLAGWDDYQSIDKSVADINGDGIISDADANILRKLISYDLTEYIVGDVDMDGNLTQDDSMLILKNSLMPDDFPFDSKEEVLADVNGDGIVDEDDALLVQKIVNGEISHASGDINGDGVTDSKDVLYLERYLAGWDGYLEPSKECADMNNDGVIDEKDLTILKQNLG